jgi:hypothetical protein
VVAALEQSLRDHLVALQVAVRNGVRAHRASETARDETGGAACAAIDDMRALLVNQRAQQVSQVTDALVQVGLLLLLVPRSGAVGAGIAFLAGNLTYAVAITVVPLLPRHR